MLKFDIRNVKKDLRNKFKRIRMEMTPEIKNEKDEIILNRILELPEYKQAQTLICFVSTDIEVETKKLLKTALQQGKKVAVPKCIDSKNSIMKVYLINSFSDLEVATYSVLEPILSKCIELTDFSNSFCVVPGLAFDVKGYRLGYGKGYYDRFLSNYPCKTIGICYNSCMKTRLPHGKYDRIVDILITEKFTKRISR